MSEWVMTHQPCDDCGSSDALSINDRDWSTCFACGVKKKIDGEYQPREQKMSKDKSLVPFGEYKPLSKRKITEETCKKFGYFIGSFKDEPVQVAPYTDKDGKVVAQKIRTASKDFRTTGEFKKVALFGQHIWGEGGKKLVICEGEIDAMSVSQLQNNRWPVVSVPAGAQGAANAIKDNLEWVMSYEEVILMFDMDEPGREACVKVAELLPPGKAKIASLPLKDANDCLVAGRGEEVISAIWNAKEFRPDGIVDIDDLIEEMEKPIEIGLPWFLPSLTKYTYGRRYGEIYAIGAGTGVGKTDLFTQQIAYDVIELNEKVGVIYLEAKPADTGKRIAGKVDGQRYHVPDAGWNKEQLGATLRSLKGKVTFYDSWGETDWDVVKLKIRYMVVTKGARLIYLDHLTAMADTADERGSLEQLMKEMAGLANELGCIIHFVSHLATPEGKPHEEGGRVMIRHFKGSRAIGFWSFLMLGMERNQQAEDETERQTTTLRILKDRYTGQATGKTIFLGYDQATGRLYEQGDDAEGFGFESNNTGSSSPPWEGKSDF